MALPPMQRPQQNRNNLTTDFFTYNATFTTGLGTSGSATASATTNITIQNDADFEIQKLTASIFSSLGTTSEPSQDEMQFFTVLFTDTGAGRQLMDAPVLVRSLFGSAELPFILPQTKILRSRSVLAVTIANLSTSADYAYIQLSFIGRKIFDLSASQ